MIHIIAVTYNQPIELNMFVSSILLQTNPDWNLHVIHDGPCDKESGRIMSSFMAHTDRIFFHQTPFRKNDWGHSLRDYGLKCISPSSQDYVLITNADNYYAPSFLQQMAQSSTFMYVNPSGAIDYANCGIVYCDTVHSHYGHSVHKSVLKEGGIDMGAFMVRADIAKHVGFHWRHYSADGAYAEACKHRSDELKLECHYVPRPLFIHN